MFADVEDDGLLLGTGYMVERSIGDGPEKDSSVGCEQLALPSAFVLQQYQSCSWLLYVISNSFMSVRLPLSA